MARIARLLFVPVLCAGAPLAAQVETASVFSRFADQVVKIQVIEAGSSAKAGVGSGFFVSASGLVITNYHVVSELVQDPERYRAELEDVKGTTSSVEIIAIDVVYDLALLRTKARPARHFTLAPAGVAQGARLYSLGHPSDLGLTIVEGTYNGLLQHTLYAKVHFTGSINPGMSGGPTITHDGRVIGINVSTAGNQLSFLVPVERALALLQGRETAPPAEPADLLTRAGEQILAYQDTYLNGMFGGEVKTVDLGVYRVPTQPAPFFRCWGDASREPDQPYQTVTHSCSTNDYIFLSSNHATGVVRLTHELITTKSLNPFRFSALYSAHFATDDSPYGTEELVTSWRCTTRNVRNGTTPMRAALCVRAYRKLAGLYDAVLKTAVLGRTNSGLVSTLAMSGVSYANIEALTARYLERVTWR